MAVEKGSAFQESQLPKLGGLQFDSGGGVVNLFRGSSSFPIQLLDLPGRNGLNYGLSLFYQGDQAHEQVGSWSLERPEEVAGVGWSLPYERIIVETSQNETLEDNRYYLVMNGQPSPLLPVKNGWRRGVLAATYQTDLPTTSGAQAVNSALIEGLLAHQIKVSENSTIEIVGDVGSGKYLIKDPDNEIEYNIGLQEDGTLLVTTGGLSFELYNYQYWRMSYYPAYERWEIVRNDGGIYSYGGDEQKYRIDSGTDAHTKQYGVKWGNWIGPSTQTTGQERYVTAWNLAKVSNPLGNAYLINYQVVEQEVKEAGGVTQAQTYTKECLVRKVKNDLGWSVEYIYQDKVYDVTSLESPKEYVDPHKDPSIAPGTTPDAYQSRYTTKYLHRLYVRNAQEEMESWTAFDYYDLWNPADLPQSFANDQEKIAYGATYDRYLKSITQYTGKSIDYPTQMSDRYGGPGLLFDYHFTTDPKEPRGLIKTIINPTGGKTEFKYDKHVLKDEQQELGQRSMEIASPSGALEAVRSWSGSDYVVTCWYNNATSLFTLKVYTWVGGWQEASTDYKVTRPVDMDRVQVQLSENTFVLALSPSGPGNSLVKFFVRDKLRRTEWGVESGSGLNNVVYKSFQIRLYGGETYYLVQDENNGLLECYTYDAREGAWQKTSSAIPGGHTYYIAAGRRYYVVLDYDKYNEVGSYQYYGQDLYGNWAYTSDPLEVSLSIPGYNGFSYCQMRASSSYVGISRVTGYTPEGATSFSQFDYTTDVLSIDWNDQTETYDLSLPTIVNKENGTFQNLPASVLTASLPGITPIPIENRAIGTGPNYIWYDGQTWTCETVGVTYEGFSNPAHQYYWYTYNGQSILKTENTDSGVVSMVRMQDPSNPTAGWTDVALLDEAPSPERYYEGYPTTGPEGLTQGETVYSVPLSSDWTGIENDIIGTINSTLAGTNEHLDSTTLINGGSYLIFLILDGNQDPTSTGVVYLKNRLLVKDAQGGIALDRFDGQQLYQMYSSSHYLQGPPRSQIARGFIGYPLGTASLDSLGKITVHRYSGERLKGDLSGFVVTSVHTHTGLYTGTLPIAPETPDPTKYQVLSKGYTYKDTRAAADGFKGAILKFDQVEERLGYVKDPGGGTEQEIYQDGYSVSHFYNGVGVSSQSLGDTNAPYSILDGQLAGKEVYDQAGVLKESTTMGWDVMTAIAQNPDGTGLQTIYGAIPVVRAQIQMKEGINTYSTNTYSFYSGAVVASESQSYNAQGEEIGTLSEVTYAYERYEGVADQHLLSLKAQTKRYVQNYSTSGPKTLVSDTVQTYKLWELDEGGMPQWGTAANYVALNATPTEFRWWASGTPDSTWRKMNEVIERGSEGNVVVSEDVEGLKTTALYDDTETFLLASFNNAAIEDQVGIHYSSFETYQGGDVWTESEAAITTEDAFIGSQCYQLDQPQGGGTSSIAKVVSNVALQTTDPQLYCFNLWVKTPGDADSSDSIALEIDAPGSTGALTESVALTGGAWKGVQWIADLKDLGVSGAEDLTLTIKFTSTTGPGYLRGDQVLFGPQQSPFAAQVYDMDKLRILGSVSANEVSEKSLYSIWDSGLTGIGVYDQTSSLATGYSVRQETTYDPLTDPFPVEVPNVSVSFGGREKGFYDEFRSDESLDHYTVDRGVIGSWAVANRQLTLGSSTGDQQLLHTLDATHSNDIAAYVDVVPTFISGESNPGLDITFGTKDFLVKWAGANTQWELLEWNSGTSSYDVLETNSGVAWQPSWHYIIVEDRVLFLANGTLIFDYQDSAVGSVSNREIALGGVYDSTNSRGFGFQNLAVLEDIQMGLGYLDGVGRNLQSLTVESATKTLLSTQVYDYLGRAPIGVLPSRLVQGTGQEEVENVLAYYPDYITNREVESALWDGSPMTGPVAEVYHPESLVDPQDPSKGGYPFSRTVYEQSPLGRPLEAGGPGETFAITGSNPHITTYTYGINAREGTFYEDPGFLYGLPENQYFKTQVTDPDGNQTTQYTTLLGQVVGTIKTGPTGADPIQSSNVYDMRGQRIHGIPPTYYENNSNPQTGVIPAGATTFTYDFLGRAIENSYPDSNERGFSTKVIYDKANRPRFMVDGQGDLLNYYNYIKYDVLGREIERGVGHNTAWGTLEANADTPEYPTSNIDIAGTTDYDGDATTPHMVGRVWKTTAYNDVGGPDSADITQIMTYDRAGETLTQEQTFEDSGGSVSNGEGIETYTYTINGRVKTSTESVTNVTETYSVNRLGQLIETYIDTGSKHVKAVYSYDQEGAIEKTDLYKPDDTVLTDRNFTYLPNGWLKETDGGFVDQTLKYTEGTCADPTAGYYNGALAHSTVGYTGLTTPPDSDYCYDVDHLSRIKEAKNHDSQQEVTDTYQWAFDNNSNFTSHTINSEIRTYTTVANMNRLQEITSTGSYERHYTYDENGQTDVVTDGTDNILTFVYNAWNGKAREIERGPTNRQSVFDYGPRNGRGRKRVKDTSGPPTLLRTTYHVLGRVEIEDNGTTVQTKRITGVQGAGLVYWKEADTFYWVLPDELGSTRMIVDEIGTVIRGYNYSVYGVPTEIVETASNLIYNYLFTGQYWDEELELYNYHARFYDPIIARFLQIDPAHQGFSPYVYVNDMPDIATDPSGRFWNIVAGAFLGVVGLALGIAGAVTGDEGLSISGQVLIGIGTSVATAGFGLIAASIGSLGAGVVSEGIALGTEHTNGKEFSAGEVFGRLGIAAGASIASEIGGAGVSALAQRAGKFVANGRRLFGNAENLNNVGTLIGRAIREGGDVADDTVNTINRQLTRGTFADAGIEFLGQTGLSSGLGAAEAALRGENAGAGAWQGAIAGGTSSFVSSGLQLSRLRSFNKGRAVANRGRVSFSRQEETLSKVRDSYSKAVERRPLLAGDVVEAGGEAAERAAGEAAAAGRGMYTATNAWNVFTLRQASFNKYVSLSENATGFDNPKLLNFTFLNPVLLLQGLSPLFWGKD